MLQIKVILGMLSLSGASVGAGVGLHLLTTSTKHKNAEQDDSKQNPPTVKPNNVVESEAPNTSIETVKSVESSSPNEETTTNSIKKDSNTVVTSPPETEQPHADSVQDAAGDQGENDEQKAQKPEQSVESGQDDTTTETVIKESGKEISAGVATDKEQTETSESDPKDTNNAVATVSTPSTGASDTNTSSLTTTVSTPATESTNTVVNTQPNDQSGVTPTQNNDGDSTDEGNNKSS